MSEKNYVFFDMYAKTSIYVKNIFRGSLKN